MVTKELCPLDYVIVEFQQRPYPGQILSIENGNFRVSCMQKAKGKGWVWPDVSDCEVYEHAQGISPPKVLSRRGTGTFFVKELEKSIWGP